jgi:uncharacterized membrane protein
MRTFGAALLYTLHQVGLSLWLGGMIVLGAVSAPAVFRTAKQSGHTEWGMPLYNFAGTATGEGFRRFNYVVLAAAVLMLVTGLAYGFLAGLCRRRLLTRAALTGVAAAIAVWLTVALFPQLIALRGAGQMEQFQAVHHTYSSAFHLQALLLLGVAFLTGWMHLERAPRGTREAAVHPARAAAVTGSTS